MNDSCIQINLFHKWSPTKIVLNIKINTIEMRHYCGFSKNKCISETSFCSGMKVLSAFANAIGHLSYFRLRDKSAEIQSTFLQFVVV